MTVATVDWLVGAGARTEPKTVLVVDDDRMVRDLVALALRRSPYRVQTAADGEEALAAARAQHPDLVVLDLGLPGLDGLEVCRRLRADPATASTAVFMLSGRAQDEDRHAGLDAGADLYFTKPFGPRELAEQIEQRLGR